MINKIIKNIFNSSGYSIYRTNKLPFGWDLKQDITRLSPDLNVKTIFDVGANKGQTTLDYRQKFPEAKIFAFEPVSKTFEVLLSNIGDDSQVSCLNLALGEEIKEETMLVQGTSGSNTIYDAGKVSDLAGQSIETVKIITLDRFMQENEAQIDRIDLLKIDTEGYECQVLKGAEATLSSEKILYIFIEVTFRQGDKSHTQFSKISEILASYNFNFVALYDAYPFWGGGNAIDYCNALFKRWEKGKNLKLWRQ